MRPLAEFQARDIVENYYLLITKTIMSTLYPRGSEWRKWDLHVHTPGGKIYDAYRTSDGTDPLDKFCDALEASDVMAFGITDYFCSDGFTSFTQRFKQRHPKSRKAFFFNLELRLNEAVNRAQEEVNVHLVFNPASLEKLPKFLSCLEVTKTAAGAVKLTCAELRTDQDYKSATVARDAIDSAFERTFGAKAVRSDHFLVVSAANNDGLRPERGKLRKENISDEIDKTSDAFFGNAKSVPYFLKKDRYEDGSEALKRPTVSGSDSHSFADLENALGKQQIKTTDGNEVIEKDVTWIKADLTYEGLKQMLYEPESGERVFIGPNRPDTKNDYKVIRKIRFEDSKDFPTEIVLNDNLCSIIGSRSSGKSALLAYIGHSIDPAQVEKMISGPGEGDDFQWNKVKARLKYGIEWANGKTPQECGGSVVYVRQNYLFEKSKDPEEIKRKIEPVLFKTLPTFHAQYEQATAGVEGNNDQIGEAVSDWFVAADEIKALDLQLREIGDKKAIEQQQKATNDQIKAIQEKNKLSEEELTQYKDIRAQYGAWLARNKEIDKDLALISNASEGSGHFTSVRLHISPALTSVPAKVQEQLKPLIGAAEADALKAMNKRVSTYKAEIDKEKTENVAAMEKIRETNKTLLEKHKKNVELEPLIKAAAIHAEQLRKIDAINATRKTKEVELTAAEGRITAALQGRAALIAGLQSYMETADQSGMHDLRFGIEAQLDKADQEEVSQGLNLRENTEFVSKNELRVDAVRKEPGKFLSAIYQGKQKTKDRQSPRVVATSVLQLTEKVLFNALMEGDKIGGFSASTMTPGKRALFALRLILEESDDTWPLLIDQPEDDLDSRAIFNEVVPFLKKKKRERQVIMVSHNANLVIGADSEQLVVANRHGDDRKNEDGLQFNYLTGSLEYSRLHDPDCRDTLGSQGVCEHACSILDGGKTAFEGRKQKYQIR
jgi:hypothetical protein